MLVLAFLARPVSAALSHRHTVEADSPAAQDSVTALLRGAVEARQLAIEYAESDSSSFASLSLAGSIGVVCVVGPYTFSSIAPQKVAVACPASSGYTSSTQLSTVVITWCVAKLA